MGEKKEKNERQPFSLSVKLNLLITAIVLIVSSVLVVISFNSFTKTAYIPYEDKLEKAEARFMKNEDSQLEMVPYFDLVTDFPDYETTRQEAIRENNYELIETYLAYYAIDFSTGSVRPRQEMEVVVVKEDGTASMIDPGDMRMDWTNLSYGLIYRISDLGISHLKIMVETPEGNYKNIIELSGSLEVYRFDLVMDLGEKYDRIEEIDLYRAQKEKDQEPFFLSRDSKTYLVRVVPKEINGSTIYLMFYDDVSTARQAQNTFLWRSLMMVGIMMLAAIAVSLFILRRMATKPLTELTRATTAFAAGEEGYSREDIVDLDITSKDEIGALYNEIRTMQTRIVDYTDNLTLMTAERERISAELNIATRIQASMLPDKFPAFPERNEFDIYATMIPAKEVGGDFYDFFLVDEDHLCMVIADVSGKGVPAALFMMTAKTLVQNKAMEGLSPSKVLENVNHQLCVSNREELFVTAWVGILEISTGKLTAANAGHEYPALKNPDGGFELVKDKHGFVLGGFDGVSYMEYTLQLEPGTKVFVYTDGVPEATSVDQNLFGTERMLEALNQYASGTPKEVLDGVLEEVDSFAGIAGQFDDITMLCVDYTGPRQ